MYKVLALKVATPAPKCRCIESTQRQAHSTHASTCAGLGPRFVSRRLQRVVCCVCVCVRAERDAFAISGTGAAISGTGSAISGTGSAIS
eukprot:3711320-Rhodomonas_salina.1